jgi:TolA-binding protein
VATKTQQKSHHHELKEDVLVTWAFQAWDRIQQNFRVIGIGLGVIVAVVLAVVWIGHAQARAEGEANRVLAEASSNYWQGGYARAIQLSDQVLSDYKSTKAANDARRMKGDALFWSGSFDSAATLYKDFLSHSPADSPVHIAVQQSLAFALESKKDYAGAAALFEQLVPTAPDRNSAADMLLCAARAYAEAGQKDKARLLYQKVVDEYKDTTLYRDADVFLGELSAPEAKDTPHPAAIVAPKPTANPTSNFKLAGQSMGANGNVTVTSLPAPKGTIKKGK